MEKNHLNLDQLRQQRQQQLLRRIQNIDHHNLPPFRTIDNNPQRSLTPHLDRIPTRDQSDRT
jgi:hypothetical protein